MILCRAQKRRKKWVSLLCIKTHICKPLCHIERFQEQEGRGVIIGHVFSYHIPLSSGAQHSVITSSAQTGQQIRPKTIFGLWYDIPACMKQQIYVLCLTHNMVTERSIVFEKRESSVWGICISAFRSNNVEALKTHQCLGWSIWVVYWSRGTVIAQEGNGEFPLHKHMKIGMWYEMCFVHIE